MGKQWKQASKIATADKKGRLFSKIAREIQVATRLGTQPENNSRLKLALQWARHEGMPSKTIQRALDKHTEKKQLEECLYEGFGPFGVAILVLCYTDNKVRTVAEVRSLFKKHGGHMEGSVLWMFDRIGKVDAQKESHVDVTQEALELEALDVKKNNEKTSFYCKIEDLVKVASQLEQRDWRILSASPSYQAQQKVSLKEEAKKEVFNLVRALEDQADCQQVYTTLEE